MAYSETVANRVREALMKTGKPVEEKKMFGGFIFMVDNKMCIGIRDEGMMCRIDPEVYDSVLENRNYTRPMIHGKRTMKGFVYVDPEGFIKNEDFNYWIQLAMEYNKKAKPSKKRRKKI